MATAFPIDRRAQPRRRRGPAPRPARGRTRRATTACARRRRTSRSSSSTRCSSRCIAGIEGDGPFGNSTGVGPWRSFLTEEYAKNFVKRGGIGIADSVYKSLLTMQEARAK